MPRNINLLLVSGSPRWGRAVRAAAADIGASLVHVLPSAREAISRLIGRHTTYSHLLLEPACAGEYLDDLVGLTSGQVGSGIKMVLLGDWNERPPEVGIIASANRRSIFRALSPGEEGECDMSEVAPAELRRALSGSMIKAWYQPIVQIVDGVPVGLEALARLKDPVRGTVLPDRFVPQIEAAGLAPELTEPWRPGPSPIWRPRPLPPRNSPWR